LSEALNKVWCKKGDQISLHNEIESQKLFDLVTSLFIIPRRTFSFIAVLLGVVVYTNYLTHPNFGKTATEKGNTPEEALEDSASLCYAHRITGNLRTVCPSRRGGGAFEKALQLDEAHKARTHEETLRHNPQSLG